jgi:hypothetical protein
MKTYDIIVEQVSNAESLARAFTPQQWRAIIHYYRQNRGFGELTDRHLNGWLRDCGSGMIESGNASSHTPGSWNRKATRYGGHVEVTGTPSWGEIYSHLARAKDEPVPALPVDQDSADSYTRYDDTPENFRDISNLIPTAPSEFTDVASLRAYILEMGNLWKTKRDDPQIAFWLDEELENGAETYPMQQWKALGANLRQILADTGTITKRLADENFFAWVKSFDTSWKRHQEDNG